MIRSLRGKNIRTKTQYDFPTFIIFIHVTFQISDSEERVE